MIKASKAQILDILTDKVSMFEVPKLYFFKEDEWNSDKESIIKEIQKTFPLCMLAVRSSAADEDGDFTARAGEYDSVLNVSSDDLKALITAVEKVLKSYRKNGKRNGDDEVIIQEMVENTIMSGVIFTHDLNTGAPYYVINYDDVSGKTDTVTSGDGEYANRTLYIHRNSSGALRSERFKKLIAAVSELETVMKNEFLDIEFAIDSELTPKLFQVRAITTQPNWNRAVVRRIDAALDGIHRFVDRRFRPMNGVFGETTVFGQMPDWNPAEMIGRAPRNLAFSLYKTLITDHAWRVARDQMDYRVPEGQPLMVSLAGQPFIDTRFSFHSYLPRTLSDEVSGKLVNAWVLRLRDNPELHDKVEFDVAITTYSFDIDDKIDTLIDGVLNSDEREEFKAALMRQTKTLIQGKTKGGIPDALNRIEKLKKRQSSVYLNSGKTELNMILKMVDECIRLGTVPFSILARHGFIARTLLLSLQHRGIFTHEQILKIQRGIRTVASDLVDDLFELQQGNLSRELFMKKYGHLRPGTYDIHSLRYDQIENFGLGNAAADLEKHEVVYDIRSDQKKELDNFLKQEHFDFIDADGFLKYIEAATAGREYGKFIFTRTVSDMLEMIADFGEENGLSREEISHIPLDDILDVYSRSGEEIIEDRLREKAEAGAEQHAVSSAIRLPQVLFDKEGVHVVPFQVSHPNFITNKRIHQQAVVLKVGETPPDIFGKIVLIESADPGFDWIFAHNISGLITKYGGANSHMAIRCAEFGIPAAIGCGEQRFDQLAKAETIELDCTTGKVVVVQ
jgi:glutamine kinase